VPGHDLMERAGVGVFEVAQNMAVVRERGVVLFVGKGNNGGDAIVAARHFFKAGRGWGPISLVMTDNPESFKGDPLYHWKKLSPLRPRVVQFVPEKKKETAELLADCGLVVDGLLGTGSSGEPRSPIREAIELINAARRPTLAIDIPSGLDADTGQPAAACVRADLTVTMGLPKPGLLQTAALDYVGHLSIVDIGIPADFITALPPGPEYFMLEDTRGLLPRRRLSAHKGDFGHLLILAGSEGLTGAAVLASRAAARAGAGLVTLGVPRNVWPVIAAQSREVMPKPFDDWSPAALGPWIEKCDAVAIGPGLSLSSATEWLIGWMLENCRKPIVLDADALNALAKDPAQLGRTKGKRGPVVITPHPGEMGRITGKSSKEIQADRWNVAASFARESDSVVVLKGAHTVVANPAGELAVNSTGNPGMASGGMGDVLTGIVGALLGQRIPAFNAARLGVWLHGAAGDIAAQQSGEEALIASDVIASIGPAFQKLRQQA
ncbi:MAG: NAD(P)H-hydrate dehydratase, partial [Verrucomicrobia bacterium]|nr:NAD(P)H-hydrate dehydratase [Verrucomicrobiota bacterium]